MINLLSNGKRIERKIRLMLLYLSINIRWQIRRVKRGHINKNTSQLYENGFLKLYIEKSLGLTNFISSFIGEEMEKNLPSYFKILEKNKFGIKSVAIGLDAPFLYEYVFTEQLHILLKNYYGGKYYLRNNPTLEFNYEGEFNSAQIYHVDWGLHQVSVMFNLSDIDKKSTHMKYISRTNNDIYFRQPNRESETSILYSRCAESRHSILDTIGPKDQVSIFDAGNGLHKQVAGGPRIMLHLNFVDNLAFTNWDKEFKHGSKPGPEYWFCGKQKEAYSLLGSSEFPLSVFDLVLQNCKSSIFTPKIYSSNIGLLF